MKYLRKIATLIISFVLFASIAIGVGVVFAVKNVNVTLQSYTHDSGSEGAKAQIAAYKERILDDLRGTILALVDKEDVEKSIGDANYVLVEFEKIYPCTLNITVRERKETYAVVDNGKYVLYDDAGVCLRTVYDEESAYNPVDNAPNVLVTGVENEEDVSAVAAMGELFGEKFSALRSTVERIALVREQFVGDTMIFYLRCGLSVELRDYTVLTEEKMERAYAVFASLSGEKKLCGRIYCIDYGNGAEATYDPVGAARTTA